MFGHHQRKLGQLGLFFFDLKIGFFCFGADLLLLLVDALQLHLCGAAVALNALVQALLVADLLFEPGDLFAQNAAALADVVRACLLRLLGGLQGVDLLGERLDLGGGVVLLLLEALMLGGGFVGGGQRLLPLHIIEQVLLLRELAGEGLIALGGFGLFFQLFHLAAQFALQIGQALQMLARVFQTAFGFFAALFIFRYARRFFYIGAQFFRPRFDNARNHALLNHGIAARAHAGAEEKIGNVAAAHHLVVDEISGFALARELALDAHFGILPPRALQGLVGIVEHKLHRCARGGAAGGGAVENHILHALAAQLFGRSFAQHPAHGIDHVGFAAAVGADHGHQLAGHVNGGGVGERFEAGKFDVGEAHEQK